MEVLFILYQGRNQRNAINAIKLTAEEERTYWIAWGEGNKDSVASLKLNQNSWWCTLFKLLRKFIKAFIALSRLRIKSGLRLRLKNGLLHKRTLHWIKKSRITIPKSCRTGNLCDWTQKRSLLWIKRKPTLSAKSRIWLTKNNKRRKSSKWWRSSMRE